MTDNEVYTEHGNYQEAQCIEREKASQEYEEMG